MDLLRLSIALPLAEVARRTLSPIRAVKLARRLGGHCRSRTAEQRDRLRRILNVIDGRLPDSGNCYRRALVQMALDPVFARERLYFGLVRNGGPRSGHAWLESDPPKDRTYEARFAV